MNINISIIITIILHSTHNVLAESSTDLKEQHDIHCWLAEIIKVLVKNDIFFPYWQS